MNLAEYIKQYRLDEAMSQEEFARKVRLTSITISRLENGAKAGSKVLKKF